MNAEEIMQKAQEIVAGHSDDRDTGRERSMTKIVEVFNTLTGKDLTEHEGNLFMVCLKLVRAVKDPSNADNYIDMAGYASMAGETQTR